MDARTPQTSEYLAIDENKSFVTTDLIDADATSQSSQNPRYWLGSCAQLVAGIYIPFLPEPRTGDSKRSSRTEVVERQKKYFSHEFQRVLQVFAEPRLWRKDLTDDFPFITFDLRFCRGFSSFEANEEDFGSSLWTVILIKATFPNAGVRHADPRNRESEIRRSRTSYEDFFNSNNDSQDLSIFDSNNDSNEPSPFDLKDEPDESSMFDSDRNVFEDPTSNLTFRRSDSAETPTFKANLDPERIRRLENVLAEISVRFRALLPSEITTLPVCWYTDKVPTSERPRPIIRNNVAYLYPEVAGLTRGFKHFAEVRRAQIVNIAPENLSSYGEYAEAIESGSATPVPLSWSKNEVDLLGVVNAIFSCPDAVALSIRVQPTLLTQNERKGIVEKLGVKTPKNLVSSNALSQARVNLRTMLNQRYLYQTVVQVGADSRESARTVANAFAAEYTQSKFSNQKITRDQNTQDLVVVTPLADCEEAVAKFNMNNMEFALWGVVSKKTLESTAVSVGSAPNIYDSDHKKVGLTDWFDSNKIMLSNVFLNRDAEMKASLARLRYLTTEEELQYIWRLPVVPPGGFTGIQSRRPNPFEQLPASTIKNGDSISLGKVQYRGLDSPTDFRIPFAPWENNQKVPGVAGVGDKSIVVAGSPGSGKTNFCLGFLRQIWFDRENKYRCPYLVIDPTRGNEFRSLMDINKGDESGETLVFTVGDSRCSPFCFNPFLVPQGVCVQSHISRLMSCFRAAYEMWDPLPAIFEMALRLAYEGARRKWWEKKERRRRELEGDDPGAPLEWAPAVDFACKPGEIGFEDEPFPTLDTVVKAMGQGKEGDDSEINFMGTGKNSVMKDQKEMWGGTTENAHTIVASTFLRLKTIQDNYGHIIGGEAPGRPCVDLKKLMQKPVILEFGMIGDSQALALIMSFLVSSLAGVIEGRGTPEPGKRHLLVLEEAHRLLEGGSHSSQGANSKAQAAEDINNMLAEVRKYGQGVMIIDQRPGSLVGGVIDNAYLVVLHRLNEEKGFNQFANQLNLSDDQQKFARAELQPGQMIVLDRRSGCPVLLRPKNENTDGVKMTDELLARLMKKRVGAVLKSSVSVQSHDETPTKETKSGVSEAPEDKSTPDSKKTETRTSAVPEASPEVAKVVERLRTFKTNPTKENAEKFRKRAEAFKSSFTLDKNMRGDVWEKIARYIVHNYNESGEFSEEDVQNLRAFLK